MSLKYNDSFSFDQNVADLATALAGKVRELEDRRNIIDTGPNHPELKANELAAIDAKLGTARLHAQAADMGVVFYDPRDVSGSDPDRQAWVARARERGRLVHPGNFGPSLHDSKEKDATPIRVIRGGNGAYNLGSPATSMR